MDLGVTLSGPLVGGNGGDPGSLGEVTLPDLNPLSVHSVLIVGHTRESTPGPVRSELCPQAPSLSTHRQPVQITTGDRTTSTERNHDEHPGSEDARYAMFDSRLWITSDAVDGA